MTILKVENLTKIFFSGFCPFKNYTKKTVVNNISFQVKKGEIVGFLGPNGAGKTTTIQMLLGTLTPSQGSISYFGQDFYQNRINLLKKIGYASGYDKLPGRLTVIDNLDVVARIYAINQPERSYKIEKLLKFFDIWKIRNQETGTLSAGQSTRVMLSKAFIANPEIILLDEPTAALDPDVAKQVRQFILEQRREKNSSILITSHNMSEVTEICDRIIVLKNGNIIADNKPDILAKSISKVKVHLTISQEIDKAITYLINKKIDYKLYKNNLTIEVDEHEIANLIIDLGSEKVIYSHISIDKPTLEDYFLSISK